MRPPPTPPRYRALLSAENTPYLAWQAKLFHFSCVRHLGHAPLVVVHDPPDAARRGGGSGSTPLHPEFEAIVAAGGTVERAPSYRTTRRGHDYACRNLPGTVLHAALRHAAATAAGGTAFFVLCDPDMLVARRRPPLPEALSGEFYSYIDYDRAQVRSAAERLGLTPARLRARGQSLLGCGSPYVIPAGLARTLAEAWLECVDAFDPPGWVDVMYAFGLAAARLDLPVTTTRLVACNTSADAPVGDAAILHYCYGDATWDKRHYTTEEQADAVWDAPDRANAAAGTMLGEILAQIGQARDYYAAAAARTARADTPAAVARRPEADLLLCCCARTQTDDAAAARLRSLLARPDLDPEHLLRQAHHHRTAPLLYETLHRACPDAVPAALLRPLREHFHANAARALFQTGELLRLLEAFARSGIPALPRRGPALAAALYGSLALREAEDPEVQVPAPLLPDADALLRGALGYDAPPCLSAAREGGPVGAALFYPHRDGRITVRLSSLDGGVWERRREVTAAGAALPAPSPGDLLAALCEHGARHGWKRLAYVCDIAELLRACPAEADRESLTGPAEFKHRRPSVSTGLLLAADLLAAPVPPAIRNASQIDDLGTIEFQAFHSGAPDQGQHREHGQARRPVRS